MKSTLFVTFEWFLSSQGGKMHRMHALNFVFKVWNEYKPMKIFTTGFMRDIFIVDEIKS